MTNQQAWNYIGQGGKVALIALQHDTATGDLLIFYDKELLWAERGVRAAQTISFFAEDELCRIHVTPVDNHLSYEFEIDRKENTPLNQIRKAEERANWVKSLLFIGAIISGLAAFVGGGFLYNKYADAASLRSNGVKTVAKFAMSKNFTREDPRIPCHIMLKSSYVAEWIALDFVGDSLVLPCGLPVYNDDGFLARIDTNEVTNNSIDLNTPSDSTLKELIFRTRDNYCFRHPESNINDIDCIVRRIYTLAGLSGLADFYYQDEPIINNKKHNKNTYETLKKHPDFAEKVLTCK